MHIGFIITNQYKKIKKAMSNAHEIKWFENS